ncbi:MAG: cupredoxin domain-containing protein, partial [Planctomycetota bacterium]
GAALMRQKMTQRVTIAVAAVLVGVLVVFSCGRRSGQEEAGRRTESHEGHQHGGHSHGEQEKQQPAEDQDTAAQDPALAGTVRDGVRVVEMTAEQFAFDPETVVVRQGEKVRLEVTSTDVTHGIGIEEFSIDQTLPPNETKEVTFSAPEPGTYQFQCSIFCGPGHRRMTGEIVVRPAPGGEGEDSG